MNKLLAYISILLIILCCSGCPSVWNTDNSKESNTSPEDLFKSAEELFEKQKYAPAIDLYEQLKSAHPDFKEIPKVYLRIADALYNDKQYDKAMGRYYQFIELYPNEKEAARAKYNVGMSLFNQIKNTDLDSRIINRTAETFKALSDDPNAGEWAKKAEEKYRECRQKLAEKELYKAKTYISMGNYQAARLVAKRVLDEYPKLGYDDQANELIKKIKNK
jgi:outer membrane protein assembly factor BamD